MSEDMSYLAPEVAQQRLTLLSTAVYIILIIFLITAGTVAYWLLTPPKQAITISKLPVPIIDNTVKAGDYVTLNIGFCKNVAADGRVTITLVSSKTQLVLPASTDSSHKGCINNAHIPLPIPPQATPDTYHYHFHAIYKVNPLRTLTSDFDTANFSVQ